MSHPSVKPAAIVTGAGSGVGAQAAKQLVDLGWNVALVGRNQPALEATAQSTSNPGACLLLPADLTCTESIHTLVAEVIAKFSRIDALINNAGMASTVPIENVTDRTLKDSFAVNTIGPGLLIAAVYPYMKQQRSGRIINVASKGIQDPFPGFFAYAAAKSALDSFTRSVENEGKNRGVRAFTVAPGAIETGMLRSMFSEKVLPPTHCLDPADVARRIVECATGERDDQAGTTQIMVQS